jgi:predicted dehydrogenase
MLEKPPGVTVSEVTNLVSQARQKGVALFATWHSQQAPAVERARSWLSERRIRKVSVIWKEDVRKWHPGQQWIWEPGGLGVFDPGINALSILTRILPRRLAVTAATLHFPSNRATPIAAEVQLRDDQGTPVDVELDFRYSRDERWDITVETDAGRLELKEGGTRLLINAETAQLPPSREYPLLYERFAELVHEHSLDVDLSPLQLVADAFMLGRREVVAAFED